MLFPSNRFAEVDSDVDLKAEDGKVARIPKGNDRAFKPADRKVFLIHGFKVPGAEAAVTLDRFRTLMAELIPSLRDDTFIVTWPGHWKVPFISGIAYPFMIGNARAASQTLRTAITKCVNSEPRPQEIIFVAHSLGCRLLVELLAELPDRSERWRTMPNLKKVVAITMAAAVPTHERDLLKRAIRAVDSFVVMHSQADQILKLIFPLGQLLEAKFRLSEAVGYAGNPPGLPWYVTEMLHHGHSDYWTSSAARLAICRALAEAAIEAPIRWRRHETDPLPGRSLPEHPGLLERQGLPERNLPDAARDL